MLARVEELVLGHAEMEVEEVGAFRSKNGRQRGLPGTALRTFASTFQPDGP